MTMAAGTSPVPAVLLIAWRRPDTTRRVIDALRAVQPARLYVAVDGADEEARPGEQAAVTATIATIEAAVDWPCDVRRRYSSENLGCRRGVSSAIDWFFSEVDEGIILEDDCVPGPDFFSYCADLLERYRDNQQVMCISGANVAGIHPPLGRSYGFVRYPMVWGWATWRRAWDRYDRALSRYSAARCDGTWGSAVPDRLESEVLGGILDRLLATGEPDTWDYQWSATVLLEKGLCIQPGVNLVQNIGFGTSATHTMDAYHPFADVPPHGILPLRHPRRIRLHRRFSRQLFLRTQISEKTRRRSTRRYRARKWLCRVRLVDGLIRRLAAIRWHVGRGQQ